MASATKLRLAAKCSVDSIVDGPGLRIVIWTQGCPHHCPFCHNPQTHVYHGGFEEEVENIKQLISETKLQSGITFSGGEPFEQPAPLSDIADYAHSRGLNIWCYSGYCFEELLFDASKKELLEKIDILVDGRFENHLKHHALKFKGSLNQRIIDVQASLKEKKIIISPYDAENQKLIEC